MKNFLCFALLLLLIPGAGFASGVNFSTFISQTDIDNAVGQTNVIGITYAGDKFVGSLYVGPNNDQLFQSDLTGNNVTAFGSPIPNGFSGEVVVGASLNNGGFTAGNIYAGAANQIYVYANSGGTPTLFGSVPDGATVRQVFFDPGSTFGGRMLVTTTAGHIYAFGPGGGNAPTLVASVGEDAEGMDILASGWGKYTGDLAVTSEGSGSVRFINPNGNIDFTYSGLTEAESVSFVPLNLGLSGDPVEGFYVANYADNIQKASASDFGSNLLGTIIVTGEFGSNSPVWDLAYSGNDANPITSSPQVGTLPNQSEDGIFVTAQRISETTAPEPSSLVLLGFGVFGAGFVLRKKRST